MNQHNPSGRPLVGLALALFTSCTWATLPIILKILVQWVDVYTLTWFRFLVAGLLLVPLVLRGQEAAALLRIRGMPLVLLLIAFLGLWGNYLTYMSGLRFISPGAGQVIMQISSILLMLGGLLIFGEAFSRLQWLGAGILIAGQVLFFYPQHGELLDLSGTYALGVFLVFVSALLWTLYMLMQKQLLVSLAPESVLCFIYFFGAVLLLPVAQLSKLPDLDVIQAVLLVLSAALTMVSYLSFGRALEHVESSRVGVVIALMPLITVMNVELITTAYPEVPLEPEHLTPISLGGAALVAVGAMCGALGKGLRRAG